MTTTRPVRKYRAGRAQQKGTTTMMKINEDKELRARLRSERPFLRVEKLDSGFEADNAPLWSRLNHLLGAALAACEREANWPPLNQNQQQRRKSAMEDMRAAMAELLDLASPAGEMPPIPPFLVRTNGVPGSS
jgi:hypothetical protein